MKNLKKFLSFSYFFVLSMLLFSVSALAYIDPSAMTYIIQIVAAGFIAAGAAFGFYFRKIKRFFNKRKNKDANADNWEYDEDDDDDTGMGDYDIDSYMTEQSGEPAAPAAAAAAATAQPREQAAYESVKTIEMPVYAEPVHAAVTDKYDEKGGLSLEAENRELRRMLAAERQKVEILKKALCICTEQ